MTVPPLPRRTVRWLPIVSPCCGHYDMQAALIFVAEERKAVRSASTTIPEQVPHDLVKRH